MAVVFVVVVVVVDVVVFVVNDVVFCGGCPGGTGGCGGVGGDPFGGDAHKVVLLFEPHEFAGTQGPAPSFAQNCGPVGVIQTPLVASHTFGGPVTGGGGFGSSLQKFPVFVAVPVLMQVLPPQIPLGPASGLKLTSQPLLHCVASANHIECEEKLAWL